MYLQSDCGLWFRKIRSNAYSSGSVIQLFDVGLLYSVSAPLLITSSAAGRKIFLSLNYGLGRFGDDFESVTRSTDIVFYAPLSSVKRVWDLTAVNLNGPVFLNINLSRMAVANTSLCVWFRLKLGESRGSGLNR